MSGPILVFWENVLSGLAQKWSDRLVSPAFAFWLAGAYLYGQRLGWQEVLKGLEALPVPLQILVILVGSLIVAGSAIAVESLQERVLRLMEGYWPSWLRLLWRWGVARQTYHRDYIKRRLDALVARWEQLSPEEVQTYIHLDAQFRAYPRRYPLLPTRLGNLLRAAEEHPDARYGLVTGVVWPHLWLILPEQARKDIAEVRERLNAAVRLCIWGVLFLVWLIWTLPGPYWPLPSVFNRAWLSTAFTNVLMGGWPFFVGMGLVWWGHRRALAAAQVYGDLLRAIFDLYRDNLYEALKWPKGEDERRSGDALTQFLWRGIMIEDS